MIHCFNSWSTNVLISKNATSANDPNPGFGPRQGYFCFCFRFRPHNVCCLKELVLKLKFIELKWRYWSFILIYSGYHIIQTIMRHVWVHHYSSQDYFSRGDAEMPCLKCLLYLNYTALPLSTDILFIRALINCLLISLLDYELHF